MNGILQKQMALLMRFSAPSFATDDAALANSGSKPELLAAFNRFRQSPVSDIGPRAGDPVPTVVLRDASGRHKALADEIKRGPVVLVFDAGPWNPEPALLNDALLRVEPEVRQLGGTLVLISSASPKKRRGTPKCVGGGVVQLMDLEAQTAGVFGVVAPVPADLRAIYKSEGYPVQAESQGDWYLPLSATYVIDRAGTIAYSSIGEPQLLVAGPTEVVTILKCLQSRSPPA